MVLEHGREHASPWAAIVSMASKIGCSPETLRQWVRQTEVDSGRRGGLPKSTWSYWEREKREAEEKYASLRKPLFEVLERHSEYGYRRIVPELEARGCPIRETAVRRVLGMWDLGLRRRTRKPKASLPRAHLKRRGWRANLVAGISTPGPFQVLYTDFSELWYERGRKKAYLIPLLDHETKYVLGWAVGPRRDTGRALEALEAAARTLAEAGLTLEGRIVHQDQDPAFTSYRWLRAVLVSEKARISYSVTGARGNTVVESFFGRLKVENGSLFHEARNVWELRRIVNERIVYHNAERRHSTLGNRAPEDYIKDEEILPRPRVALAQPST